MTHVYATDDRSRTWGIVGCVVLALGILLGVHYVEAQLVAGQWWAPLPSFGLVFGVLYGILERWAWKWPIVRILLGIRVPNLTGIWEGHISSSYDRHEGEQPVTVRIKQTWRKMGVRLEADQSSSESRTASIVTDTVTRARLSYEYFSEPRPGAAETMKPHHGTTVLRLRENGTLEGHYYSDHHRGEAGRIRLARSSDASAGPA